MCTLKRPVVGLTAAAIALAVAPSYADSGIPHMVGRWTGTKEVVRIIKQTPPVAASHGEFKEFETLHIEYDFTKQEGRLLKGVKITPNKTEQIVCAIAHDHRAIHCADENGSMEGEFVKQGEIVGHYHHITADDSAVATVTLTKIK